jgi:hypothetical protein
MVAARTGLAGGVAEGQEPLNPGAHAEPASSDRTKHHPLSNNVVPMEQHYAPSEVAAFWALSENTIRSLFENEPGVLIIDRPEQRHKRGYRSMRIPESVIRRVGERLGCRRAS